MVRSTNSSVRYIFPYISRTHPAVRRFPLDAPVCSGAGVGRRLDELGGGGVSGMREEMD